MTYSEKLKDPRWQKKRLEILNRDNFTCQSCGDTTKTLHVHHIHYYAGMLPWEYAPEILITLCEDCHQFEEARKKEPSDWSKHLMLREIDFILGEYLTASWYQKDRLKLFNETIEFLKSHQKNG